MNERTSEYTSTNKSVCIKRGEKKKKLTQNRRKLACVVRSSLEYYGAPGVGERAILGDRRRKERARGKQENSELLAPPMAHSPIPRAP